MTGDTKKMQNNKQCPLADHSRVLERLGTLEKQALDEHPKIFQRIFDLLGIKIGKTMFLWIIGGLVVIAMTTLGGILKYQAEMANDVKESQQKIVDDVKTISREITAAATELRVHVRIDNARHLELVEKIKNGN